MLAVSHGTRYNLLGSGLVRGFGCSSLSKSGICTVLLLSPRSHLPSRVRSALLRTESLSPKLILSSELEAGRSVKLMRIISADSTRVETEDRRR